MRRETGVGLLVLLTACGEIGAARAPVVYETDDRVEVYEAAPGVHRAIAESAIAMQMGVGWLDFTNPDDVRITYEQTLGEAHSLCAGVRYAEQLEPGTCSGTLIDERHILTAGHCVATSEDCDGASWPWVFGFSYQAAGSLRTLSTDDVYYCTRTVAFRNDLGGDYAVIELDRTVVGHTPARIGGDAPIGTPVTMIGHPNGIPMKIAGNATVRGAAGVELFADVDAFFGNSGSGVFDDGGEVIGILVAGAPRDFENRPGGCREIVVIDPVPAGEGETLTAVAAPIDAFCAMPSVSSPVCDPPDAGAGPLDAGGADAGADAATPARDAGAPSQDAATTSPDDAGTAGVDAGAPPSATGGCGCRASGSDAPPAGLFAVLALFALRRRARIRAAGTSRP